jgi:deoxycytidylate deaminase
MVSLEDQGQTQLHDDLVAMLTVTGAAEHDLFAMLQPDMRDLPGQIGEWSAKDVLGHLAAWRSIEARRLTRREGAADPGTDAETMPRDGEAGDDDPADDEPIDETNARLHAERDAWSWEQVAAAADESIEALAAAIRSTPAAALQSSSRLVAGIGANGANHALGHLSDVASMAGGDRRFRALATEIEAILMRGEIPDDGAGTLLYNIACHDAMTGRLDDARRRLRDAFRLRPDLVAWAEQDSDVAALQGELRELAAAGAVTRRED